MYEDAKAGVPVARSDSEAGFAGNGGDINSGCWDILYIHPAPNRDEANRSIVLKRYHSAAADVAGIDAAGNPGVFCWCTRISPSGEEL